MDDSHSSVMLVPEVWLDSDMELSSSDNFVVVAASATMVDLLLLSCVPVMCAFVD